MQENVGFSGRAYTLRGLHFQQAPYEEVKLVRCTAGAVWDVAVDLRERSPTYRRWAGVELSAADRNMLYVPEGCAHGYLTLTDEAETRYLTSQYYEPEAASGLRYDDPALGIRWPADVVVVSEADLGWPLLETSAGDGRDVIILDKALERREADGDPIRVAIVGAGYMARGIAAQVSSTTGMEVVAISNRTPETAAGILEEIGDGDVTRARLAGRARGSDGTRCARRERGPERPLPCGRRRRRSSRRPDEVEFGARVVLDGDRARKHVVLVNAELDATRRADPEDARPMRREWSSRTRTATSPAWR